MSKHWGTHTHKRIESHTLTHTQRHRVIHAYMHTETHRHTHLHAHRHTLLLLFVAQSCANDFQHIYNYCKCVQNFKHYAWVWVCGRQREAKESESMCVCVRVQSEHSILPVAAFCRSFTTRVQRSQQKKRGRDGSRERSMEMGQLHGVLLFWAFYTFGAP